MSNAIEVKVPDIGDFGEVDVIEVLVAPGDAIKAEQSLITVESDKASMEIPSPQAGVVKSLRVKVGDKVKEGSVILEIEQADSAKAGKAEPAAKAAAAPKAEAAATPAASAAPAAAAAAPAPAAAGSAPVSVIVPNIGDFNEVEVI